MKLISIKNAVVAGTLVLTMLSETNATELYSLNFNDNAIPNGWAFSSYSARTGYAAIEGGTFAVHNIDGRGTLSHSLDPLSLATTSRLTIQYDGSMKSVYWGDFNWATVKAGSTDFSNYSAMAAYNFGPGSLLSQIYTTTGGGTTYLNSNQALQVNDPATFHFTQTFENGRIGLTVQEKNMQTGEIGRTVQSLSAEVTGFNLQNATQISLGIGINAEANHSTPVSSWIDNVRITADPLLPYLPSKVSVPSRGQLFDTDLSTFDKDKPTIVITHGWQAAADYDKPLKDSLDWVVAMKEAIGTAANVITWGWRDAFTLSDFGLSGLDSATGRVADVGRDLAKTIEALPENVRDNLHFIGHSLGTLVNAYAVDALSAVGIKTEQFTILDRPFGTSAGGSLIFDQGHCGPFDWSDCDRVPGNLDEPIFRTLLREGEVKYVDNYYGTGKPTIGGAATGAAFTNATALNEAFSGAAHSDVHEWYRCSIVPLDDDCTGIFKYGTPQNGWGWPNKSANPMTWNPNPNGSLVRFDQDLIGPDHEIDWLKFNCTLQLSGAVCREGSPAYLWQSAFSIPTNALYLSFDLQWLNGGDGDWLELLFGDRLLFSAFGDDSNLGDWISSGLIPIAGLGGNTDQLLFALNSVGERNAEFGIRNLRFVLAEQSVPEPGSILLLLISLAALFCVQRGRPMQSY